MTYFRKWQVINPGQVGSVLSNGMLLALLTGEPQIVEADSEAHAMNLQRSGHFEPVEGSDVEPEAQPVAEPLATEPVVPAPIDAHFPAATPQPAAPAPDAEGAAQ